MVFLQLNSSSVSLYVFPYYDDLALKHHSAIKLSCLKNMCSRGTLLASLNSSNIFSVIFYHVSPIYLESESICFGVSTSLSPNFIDDGKDVLSYNLHAMGGICKEGWLWYFLVKFSFGRIRKLTLDTYGCMLLNSFHCAIIIAENDINDKE